MVGIKIIPDDAGADLETRISDVLLKLGIVPHLTGFRYDKAAIELVVKDGSLISAITKEVYPTVAKMHKTTSGKVERAIRTTVVYMCKSRNDFVKKLFSDCLAATGKDKPTNSEFLAIVAEYIRLNKEV